MDWINDDYNVKIAGVNTAYLYFGMWKSAFAWHTEDMDLHSINYLHHGESKFWYSIPSEYARRFERMALGLFPQFAKDCPSYLRHKMCMISPSVLRQNSIPYNKVSYLSNKSLQATASCNYVYMRTLSSNIEQNVIFRSLRKKGK